MRSIHELLKILLKEADVKKSFWGFRKRISAGLCRETYKLVKNNIISKQEQTALFSYIITHIPRCKKSPGYGWKPKLWRPRRKWLETQIKLTK